MPKWIRVRDTQTGHTFDIDSRALKHRRGVEPLNDERWPDLEGPHARPRPAKPFVGKDGRARSATAEPDADATATEPTAADGQPATDTPTATPPPEDATTAPTEGEPALHQLVEQQPDGEAFVPRGATRRGSRRTTTSDPATTPADTSKEQ